MCRKLFWSQKVLFVMVFLTVSCFAQRATSNTISGFIYEAASNTPVSEVYVELQTDVYSYLRRVKTDGSGRYFFGNLSSGTFKVKVLPYGTNYAEETQDATITNYRFGGNTVTSDNVYLDFYLRLDKRKVTANEALNNTTIFVQEVPAEARNLFKKAISELSDSKNTAAGIETLKKSLEIFPNFYDSLNRLGIEYVKRNEYFESLPYLIKAIGVNQRSFSSFYALGIAAYNLKQYKEALEAFRATIVLNTQSVFAHWQYGKTLRVNGNYKEAEPILVKAKTLSKDFPMADIHWQLALVYEKLGKFNEAATEFETYLKLEPDAVNVKQIKAIIQKFKNMPKTQK